MALAERWLRKRGAKRIYAGSRHAFPHSHESVTTLILDVTSTEQIRKAVESIETLDILINNAGVDLHDDLSNRAGIDRHLAVNLFGTHSVTQALYLCWSALREPS